MSKNQRSVFWALLVIGAAYFVLFIPANQTGAKDVSMLALFEVDEYAQFPNLIQMLTPGPTVYQTIRNFFVYLHYFYGYPFYFFSALLMLPFKLALGADWLGHVRLLVAALRQGLNVLPMVLAVGLLVWVQTRFRPAWKAVGLFVLLLALPAVVLNDLWWHPDSLVFFFVALTLFFLDRDDLRFGRNFVLAAAACGLAVGTKHLGLFYVLAVPLYLGWGVFARRISWKRAVGLGALFVGVMAAAVVVSNPLLLLPQERAAIIAVQKEQVIQTGTGVFLANKAGFLENGRYPQDMRVYYGELAFVLLGFAALLVGLARPERRRLSALILAWMIPITIVTLSSGTRRTHYFLPILLPLFSTLVNLFPEGGFGRGQSPAGWARRLVWIGAGVLIVAQLGLFARTDVTLVAAQLAREETSKSLAFTRALEEKVLAQMPSAPRVVYRDWRVYFPRQNSWQQVEMNWDLATYAYIDELKPDLILLERENVLLFAKPEVVGEAVKPEQMKLMHAFYGDAAASKLKGYRLAYMDGFGYAFVRDEESQKPPSGKG
jgi:hypothetical protein